MKTKKKILPDSYAEVTIELSIEELNSVKEIALLKIQKDLDAKGFRKGKVPINMIPNLVKESQIQQSMIDAAVDKFWKEAVEKYELLVLVRPEINISKLNFAPAGDEPAMEMVAKAGIMQIIELADLSKWNKKFKAEEVTDKEVDDFLDDQRYKMATFEEHDKAVKDGDKVEIDFKGKIDGIWKERLTSMNYPVILGRGFLLPEFEKAIIGMKKGEKKTFKMVFPKDYFAKEFAGKEVEFEIKLNFAWKTVLPELNDSFAKVASQYRTDSVDQLKKDFREYLEGSKRKSKYESLVNEFQDFLLKGSKVAFPRAYLDFRVNHSVNHFKNDLSSKKTDFKNYLKKIHKTEEEFVKNVELRIKKEIALGFLMSEIIKVEKIDLDPKEMEAFDRYYKSQKRKPSPEDRSSFRSRVLIEQVYDKYIGNMYDEKNKDKNREKQGNLQEKNR